MLRSAVASPPELWSTVSAPELESRLVVTGNRHDTKMQRPQPLERGDSMLGSAELFEDATNFALDMDMPGGLEGHRLRTQRCGQRNVASRHHSCDSLAI
jgi:hypothetical protein